MKKNILSLLLIISIITSNLQLVSAENQASTINAGILKFLTMKGVQNSESYDDNLSCTNSIIENNKKFPNFSRKGCFYDSVKTSYFYIIYSKDLEETVNSKLSLQSNVSSNVLKTNANLNTSNNTQNNYNISYKNKATLDKIILGAKKKQSTYKTNEEYISFLDNLNQKVTTLKDKYTKVKGFANLMNYLSEGVSSIKNSILSVTTDDNIESILNNEFGGSISNNASIITNTGTTVSTQVIKDSCKYKDSLGQLYKDLLGKCINEDEYKKIQNSKYSSYEELAKSIACTGEGLSSLLAKDWLKRNNESCDISNNQININRGILPSPDIQNTNLINTGTLSNSGNQNSNLSGTGAIPKCYAWDLGNSRKISDGIINGNSCTVEYDYYGTKRSFTKDCGFKAGSRSYDNPLINYYNWTISCVGNTTSYTYSWVLGEWSSCNNSKTERSVSCKKNDGIIVANSNCTLVNGSVESGKSCIVPGSTKTEVCSNLPENANWVNIKGIITQTRKKNEGSANQDYVYLPYNTAIYSNDTNFCSYKCNTGFHYFKDSCIKNGESYDKNELISTANTKYTFINGYQFNSISDYSKSLESNINYCKINNLGSTMIRQQYTFKHWTTNLSEDAGYEIWCVK